MFNDDPSVETLSQISAAHRTLGTTAILPTLITDTAAKTRAAIKAAKAAITAGVPGIAGLHLEGPHLSAARKGAHDAALIRPMDAEDLTRLLAAAERIENLMVTVAPESTSPAQISAMSAATLACVPECGWTLVWLAPKRSLARSRQRFSTSSTCSQPP